MPGGRPPKYDNAEEMQSIVDLYFIAIKVNSLEDPDARESVLSGYSEEDKETIAYIEDLRPTVSGLAYTLDMATETLRDYGTKDEFSATVKKAKQRLERFLEQNLYGQSVVGTIFNLKNNFGWKDKTERGHSGVVGTIDLSDKSDEELNAIINGQI